MARKNITTLAYPAIRIEGGLIPADELTRLTTLVEPEATEQTEAHYRISKGLKIRDEIARDFKIALSLWKDFQVLRKRVVADSHEITKRELLLPLLREVLHFNDIGLCAGIESGGHSFAVEYIAEGGRIPIIFAAHNHTLDSPAERFGELNPDTGKVRRRSPYMLAQEALNAADGALWAIVTNGLSLRILRDNPSLTRPAYIEVDLEALFTEELHADFSAFWLMAHASRFGGPPGEPDNCVWERWRKAGQAVGVTVRTNLRFQVADALRALGTGFVSHPANIELRAALQQGDGEEGGLSCQAFFEELLRLVYRLIFLSTVEDRNDKANGRRLIFRPDASEEVQQRYLSGYSMTWLRERAVRRSQHDRHADLWQALSITFASLATGQVHLGLPALGGLFETSQCAWLDRAQLENRYLLAAVFQLGWFRAEGGLTRVNYRDMGPEELGSVYESLLELVPDLQMLSQPSAARLAFVGDDDDGSTRGNTRKLTGSYYTPDNLVQELIKTALEPVIADTVRANPASPVEALLSLSICDPACGSGHFLLSAARRLADEVALQRAITEREGGAPTPTDYRHALRDVVSHCIYGVDKNPMAIQLAKTALWLEAYSPDRPLSFIDHHLQVGDALLGVLDPKVLENGIPDEAYTALSGDDKSVASALKKQNKADLKSWRAIASGDLLTHAGLALKAVEVETLADDSPGNIAAKRAAWHAAQAVARHSTLARLADTYVAAFLAPKLANLGERVPLSGYLWGILSNQTPTLEIECMAQALCRTHGVFHWWLAFPQIAAQGGFSVMLGNPPWERIKLQEEEFFANRSTLVATAKNKAERSQRIEWLREGVLLHNLNPDKERAEGLTPPNSVEIALYDAFLAARRGAEAASLFAHKGRRYPLTGVGDVNTYALFAETILQATSKQGRAGFIVPIGIATDDSTKAFFERVAVGGFLRSLLCLENEEFVFPAVHHSFRFALLTLAGNPWTEAATLVFFARQPDQIHDVRRQFQLTSEEFALLNPNTRTCPVFRSERDTSLTKKLHRTVPVLIRESQFDSLGQILEVEVNSWGIRFQTMMHMSSDSGLFLDQPLAHSNARTGSIPRCLPLYEAKMIHQYDHRWASYVDTTDKLGGLEIADVSFTQKVNYAYTVRPRYWVSEREVLARIARVPTRVARSWLALHSTESDETQTNALDELLLALAAWVVGELFIRVADETKFASGKQQLGGAPQSVLNFISAAEAKLHTSFQTLSKTLLRTGMTTKKALVEFPKWAQQNADVRLSDSELESLSDVLSKTSEVNALLDLIDIWMDKRSPQWLFGFRNIARSTDERSFIATVIPRFGVGHSMPLFQVTASPALAAVFIGMLSSLTFDYVVRQKLGGTNMTFGYVKQFPTLPIERFAQRDIEFIVPRVLELTYTSYDLQPWFDDLASYDPRPPSERSQPFTWNSTRRALLRAELDAYFADLYDLTRDELRYMIDPADVMGSGYPSETFRVLKNNEIKQFGEYRTQRLVLEAWDRLHSGLLPMSQTASSTPPQFSVQGMIRNEEEAMLAGLIIALVEQRPQGSTVPDLQSILAVAMGAEHYLDESDKSRFIKLSSTLHVASAATQRLDRVFPIVQRLESAGVLTRKLHNGVTLFKRGSAAPPRDVHQHPAHVDVAQLLISAEQRRTEIEQAEIDSTKHISISTGTK